MVAGQGSHGQRRGMSPLKCGISEPMLHFQFGQVGQPFCQANYIEQVVHLLYKDTMGKCATGFPGLGHLL